LVARSGQVRKGQGLGSETQSACGLFHRRDQGT
jgi:hypothetical protein